MGDKRRCDHCDRLAHVNRTIKIGGDERVHHRLRRHRPLVAFGDRSECSAAHTPRGLFYYKLRVQNALSMRAAQLQPLHHPSASASAQMPPPPTTGRGSGGI